ncbi:epoxide hydrolase N-terminal domain-containing protein [Cellulomonas cellasea]|uniref:Epoxide hydrolase N-terminal domain-containing protein n=1 Tax=Cellulomonas cellasea TaxID=43670 RepID=A0A7W4UFA1_9CELL|nr:epoxide hydrolase N-terminal domain-containing protein [Cellulomonas cellasea]MBB2923027.1 hypothetical protein [Cellulomonas cellasea]
MSRAVVPFRVDVAQDQLDDLADRLRRTRFPERATAGGWTQGVPPDHLRDVCRTWTETCAADGAADRAPEAGS